ncbi:hypothetical protein ACFOY2_01635 [Nonomuraea purpurea]|uniref:Uncharacterized protein n=1 Tax=Nonomuraea purpurea TaxID=1849276 RepID=A0ABV8FY40_9ACTN
MDYYLIFASAGDVTPVDILIEEFVLCDDFTAAWIDSAAWRSETGAWAAAPGLSREIRSDPRLRGRARAVGRNAASEAYTLLGGGDLPEEPDLRGHFDDRVPLPAAAPLDLGTSSGTRRYRILFAGDLGDEGLMGAREALRLEPTDNPRVVGTATGSVGGHGFAWELRRIGAGIAWCVDVTVRLGTGPGTALGALLHHHRQAIRDQGLIPVTIERFA